MKNELTRIPYWLFCIFLVKSLLDSPTMLDIAFCGVLGAIVSFLEYKASYKALNALKDELKVLSDKLEDNKKEISDTKTYISTVKMGQGMKITKF